MFEEDPKIDPNFDASKITPGTRIEVIWDIVVPKEAKEEAQAKQAAAAALDGDKNPENSSDEKISTAVDDGHPPAAQPEEGEEEEAEPIWFPAVVQGPGSRENSFVIKYEIVRPEGEEAAEGEEEEEQEVNEVIFYGDHLLKIVSRSLSTTAEPTEEETYTVWRLEGDDYEPPADEDYLEGEEDDYIALNTADPSQSEDAIRQVLTSIVSDMTKHLPMDAQMMVAERFSSAAGAFTQKLAEIVDQKRKRQEEEEEEEEEGEQKDENEGGASGSGPRRVQKKAKTISVTEDDIKAVFHELKNDVNVGQ